MENASKALLIAAAVLVVIILIAIGMKIYSSTTDAQKVGLDTGRAISEKTGDAADFATYEITGETPKTEKSIAKQIKLAYQKFKDSGDDVISKMQNELKRVFNDNTLSVTGGDNNRIKVSLNVDNNAKQYIYDINEDKVSEYIDPINYGGKTRETIQLGDDLTIGTEKFKVFSKTSNEIKAMPYYNLKLDSNPIKQATSATANSAGTSNFSREVYWTKGSEININDSRNKIQQFVIAYKNTLQTYGTTDIDVQIAKYADLMDYEKTPIRNPSKTGNFWLSRADYNYNDRVYYVFANGELRNTLYYNQIGVRPIIIIPIY